MTQDSNITDPSTSTDSAEIKREAQNLGDTARDVGKEAYNRISETGVKKTEQVKDGAASEIDNVSSALRSAAEKSREGSPQERTFGQAAEALADFSDTVRNKDLGQLVSDVNSFARKNPMAFLGGAALLGFAATRFAKASSNATGYETSGIAQDSATPNNPVTSTRGEGMPASPAVNTMARPSDTITPASKEHF